MVNAEPRQDTVIDALKAGRFYSSSGVTLTSLRLEDGTLVVESEDAQEIRFYADRGSMRHFEKGSSASYAVREDDIYVRVELFGPGTAKAWTNPVFVETDRSRELSEEFRTWYAGQQKVLAEI
jgi:hypothetical protein